MPMPMAMAMAGHKVYGSSNISALLQNEALPGPSHLLDSLWAHTPDPSFRGSNSKPVVDFENVNGSTMRDRPFLQGLDKEENGEEEYEACFHQPGKKRRLTSEQVQFLERNFEVENKLEPERKVQLAKELGLQPRQVAIWFQNRRARFKTKQLEKDYAALKACYDKLKGDYDTLLHQNEKLKQEMNSLKNKLMGIEKDKSHDAVRASEDGSSSKVVNCCKQEDANSAKSDVFDSDSPPQHTADSSSHAVEAEQCSDFSQDEEDDLSHNLLTLPCLPKVEDDDAAAAAACNFGFPDEDQTFSFWPY